MTKKPSPFPVPARTSKPRIEIDTSLLKVEHDAPMPRFKSTTTDKYGPVFSQLKPGSCVRCETPETLLLAQALRKALDLNKYPALKGCKVLSRTKCPDGHGRVWAMPADK
jgi:hypothetical protein